MASARAHQRLGALQARAEVMYEADDPDVRRETLRRMRADAEAILAEDAGIGDPDLRVRTFLALAAATFSLGHLSRGAEHDRLTDQAIADCEQAVAALDGLDADGDGDAGPESVSETLALLTAAGFSLDGGRRRRIDSLAQDVAGRLCRLVPTDDEREPLLGAAAARAEVALTSVMRRTGTASASETLNASRAYFVAASGSEAPGGGHR